MLYKYTRSNFTANSHGAIGLSSSMKVSPPYQESTPIEVSSFVNPTSSSTSTPHNSLSSDTLFYSQPETSTFGEYTPNHLASGDNEHHRVILGIGMNKYKRVLMTYILL